MNKILLVTLLCFVTLFSCTNEIEHKENIESKGAHIFSLVSENYEGSTRAMTQEEEEKTYSKVIYYLTNSSGEVIQNLRSVYRTESTEIIIEDLHEGEYNLLVLAVKGEHQTDGVKINKVSNISDTWIEFPHPLGRSLKAEYFYSNTPFTVSSNGEKEVTNLDRQIRLKRIISKVEFPTSYNNEYVKTATTKKEVEIKGVSFYSNLAASGTFGGNNTIESTVFDLTEKDFLLLPPTLSDSKLKGNIKITTRAYTGETDISKFSFEQSKLEANKVSAVNTSVEHDDDNSGTAFITKLAYEAGNHKKILQDDEHHTVYTDRQIRSFNTTEPLQVRVEESGRLNIRFYSPRPLKKVLIKAQIPELGDYFFDFIFFDEIPGFADFYAESPMLRKETIVRTDKGEYIRVNKLEPQQLRNAKFKIESEDEYWGKLSNIKVKWNISFGLYGGDPTKEDGAPKGSWMGIRPVHCREAVALFLNFTYMIDMQEHENILRENESILYGNGGVNDKVTAEQVLSQMRQTRTIITGLVYAGGGTLGLGGGTTFGAYEKGWFTHYSDTYSCEIMFHELGHVMGYNHSSTFTYGPWAQRLMNNFYIQNLSKMPIDSDKYLNSKNNPNRYYK